MNTSHIITVTFPSFRICTLFNRKLTCRLKLVSCFGVGVIEAGGGGGSGGIVGTPSTASVDNDCTSGEPARYSALPLSRTIARCISLSSNATSFSSVAIRASFVSIIALYVLVLGLGVWMAFSNCIWSVRKVSLVALSSWHNQTHNTGQCREYTPWTNAPFYLHTCLTATLSASLNAKCGGTYVKE